MDLNDIAHTILTSIHQGTAPPYVYTYPPRSGYVTLDTDVCLQRVWSEDIKRWPHPLNLYIHIPFCRYKCGFCNLYSTAIEPDDSFLDEYISAVCIEIDKYAHLMSSQGLSTVYIGGGTPMMLKAHHFMQLDEAISSAVPGWKQDLVEYSIEASPDATLDAAKTDLLDCLVNLGINRVNLGIQSFSDTDIIELGRDYASTTNAKAITTLREHGISNISTDLIAGFAPQSIDTWICSLHEMVSLLPDTISIYHLRIRPDSQFGRRGKTPVIGGSQYYRWYDLARDKILASGYYQQTNVRFALSGSGGYEQQDNQFRGDSVVGIGAGARSYNWVLDYITGGGQRATISDIKQYADQANTPHLIPPTSGFSYTDDERVRKYVMLNLYLLSMQRVGKLFGTQYQTIVSEFISALTKLGLGTLSNQTFTLTQTGYKFRDIICWALFSKTIKARDGRFYSSMTAC